MAEVTLDSLIQRVTKSQIYAKLLTIASALGLATESWQPGDPTRTTFDAVSRTEETRDDLVIDAIKGGFRGLAKGSWLTLCARYLYKVERQGATYATFTGTLTNGSGAAFLGIQPGDLTARNPTTKKTYHNTTGGDLAGGVGETLPLEWEADEAGSASSSGVGAVTELVTALPNVSFANTTAGVGTNEESDPALDARCEAKMQSISPGGPKGAYHYFATTKDFNGGAGVTNTRVFADKVTGIVTVIIRGPSGPVDTGDVALVEAALDTYATPLCIEVDVVNATAQSLNITYILGVYDTVNKTTSEIETLVFDALTAAFAAKKPGFDITPDTTPEGRVYKSNLEAIILNAVAPHGFGVSVLFPLGDTTVYGSNVVTVGTLIATINQVTP